jgi:magnesium transporter
MRTYWNINRTLRTLEQWEPNCWTQVTCPTVDDEVFLTQELKIPNYFLDDIRDKDERARYEFDEGWVLIILRIPYVKEVHSHTPHTTIPLGIILNKEICVTICNYEANMMIDFVSYQQKRNMGFTDSVDLVFRLFLSSSVWYLKRLKQINILIEESKRNLDKKIDNEDLIDLSRLQDSLTYFITSIRGNETLLSKLKFKLPVDELDADLIEDVNIEMNQAREITNIYTHILDSTMETYANIINNNTSRVMKSMTSISIILMFPTLIASLFGMNLVNGIETADWGFPFACIISFGITALFFWFFRRKTWI